MVLHINKKKKTIKKAKILILENQAMLFVKTFLVHNSMTKILPEKLFLPNVSQK